MTSNTVFVVSTNYYQNCSSSSSAGIGRKRRAAPRVTTASNVVTTTIPIVGSTTAPNVVTTTIPIVGSTTAPNAVTTTIPIVGSTTAPINGPQTQSSSRFQSTSNRRLLTTNAPTTIIVCNNYSKTTNVSKTNIITNYINSGPVLIQVI